MATTWGEDDPQHLWFDSIPWSRKCLLLPILVGGGLCLLYAISLPAGRVWLTVCLVVLPLVNRLELNLADGRWTSTKGIWPFTLRSHGHLQDLYGIELRKASNFGPPRYYADLHWQPGGPPRKALYSTRSFESVARPAIALSDRLGIPLVLDHNMAAFYATRLDRIKSGVAYISPLQ